MFSKTKRAHIDVRPRFVQTDESGAFCVQCGDEYPLRRLALGYNRCLSCSNEKPKVVNMANHKQGYGYTHNPDNLKENPYSTHK